MPINDNKDRLSLRSEEVQEILSRPPNWLVRWGITIIFLLTCLVLLLSFLIRYPDFIEATAIVTTKKPTERVVARYSGTLEKVLVKNGDTVRPGDRLAVIRNTAKTEDVNFLKALIDSTKVTAPQLNFPINSTSELVLGDIEPAYIAFERSYIEYELLNSLDPYAGELINNEQTITEIKNRLENQISQKRIQEQELQLKLSNFKRQKHLFDKGIISAYEFEKQKIELLQVQEQLKSTAISISQLRESVASGNHILNKTKINKQEEQKMLFSNFSQSFYGLKKAIRDWEYIYSLKSSTYGILSFQEFWGANQFVNSDETVFSILPLGNPNYFGKLIVPSQSVGKISIGQKVLIKLNNFPSEQYGTLVGEIENLSVSPNIEGNYFAYISLPQGTTTSYNITLSLGQELVGMAEIITEDLSLAQRIFYRLKDLF
ncbi:HlyD family secretion protein [Salegentibacter sp. UBA1130]|uniref:HlyD family secretion protein n=1 Tax=Salegentibacter sp. UBA1130 TaxID=1947451 RepID=UPI00257EB7B9|nr:HlyD family efflux transporter periplasmic adaptor subunit [Salegentibacter sp. UBA1130]